MDNSASRVRSRAFHPDVHSNDLLSKLKTYRFAIAIIVGIGGLVVGGAGLAGYFQVGALSNLSQVHAIIMMTAGGGGGTILLVVGIVSLVKNHHKSTHQPYDRDIEYNDRTRQPNQVSNAEIIQSIDTRGLVYGRAAWQQVWGVDVLNDIPETPVIDWNANDPYFDKAYRENYVLLYIPEKIRVNSEVKDLTLQTFKEISGGPFTYFNQGIVSQFGDSTASGWMLISKKVIPGSRNESYETQKNQAKAEPGFRMPHVFEAVVLNLMIFASTGERLFRVEEPGTYTRCIEKLNQQFPVVVGGFGSDGLYISTNGSTRFVYGVAVVRKF